jgi:hypothetical protein
MIQDRRQAMRNLGIPLVLAAAASPALTPAWAAGRATAVAVAGNAFHINGKPTYPGRVYKGSKVEGQLFTSRMVNCIIDDKNPETRGLWAWRDGPWDPERNTREFIAMLPTYRKHGLTSIAFNIQGGSPVGYGWNQPWHTSGYTPDGHLLPDYRARLLNVLDAADAAGMAVVLGYFYLSATPGLADEAAVIRATDEMTDLIVSGGYTNVMIEVANECDLPRWPHPIILPSRSHELVTRVQQRSAGKVATRLGRLLVSTSFATPAPLPQRLLEVADYVLYHGNALATPQAVHARAREIRATQGYKGQPLLINEDDHFDFDKPDNNMLAAVQEYSGWGYFDYRQIREPFEDGYQSLPVDWGINSARKKGFFGLLAKITGSAPL